MAHILFSGFGNLAKVVRRAAVNIGHSIHPIALETQTGRDEIINIDLAGPELHRKVLEEAVATYPNLVVFDASEPKAAPSQLELFTDVRAPSVIATTGDQKLLTSIAQRKEVTTILAPNMAERIVAIQSAIHEFAQAHEKQWLDHPKAKVYARESHQGFDPGCDFYGKADTSGTMRAVMADVVRIGALKAEIEERVNTYLALVAAGRGVSDPVLEKARALAEKETLLANINLIRDRNDQLKLGVPEKYLKGHGWHTYTLFDYTGKNAQIIDALAQHLQETIRRFALADRVENIVDPVTGGITKQWETKTEMYTIANVPGKQVSLTHNINGREPYGIGAAQLFTFADKKRNEGKVYTGVEAFKEIQW